MDFVWRLNSISPLLGVDVVSKTVLLELGIFTVFELDGQ